MEGSEPEDMKRAERCNPEKKGLTNSNECIKINANGERWLVCPSCGRQKLLRLLPGTVIQDLPVYCKLCRKESVVNIRL